MAELWEWVCAAAAFDFGDPAPLAALVAQEPVPAELRGMLADIIAGKRKGRRSSGHIAAAERLRIAAGLSFIVDLCDTIANSPQREAIADRKRLEPAELRAELAASKRAWREQAARDLGVSVETVENLVRDLRARIARWPAV